MKALKTKLVTRIEICDNYTLLKLMSTATNNNFYIGSRPRDFRVSLLMQRKSIIHRVHTQANDINDKTWDAVVGIIENL